MRKIRRIKFEERLQNNTSTQLFDTPGAAADYAAQEAFAAGVRDASAIMNSSPDGAGTGDFGNREASTTIVTVPDEVVESVQNSAPPADDEGIEILVDDADLIEVGDDEIEAEGTVSDVEDAGEELLAAEEVIAQATSDTKPKGLSVLREAVEAQKTAEPELTPEEAQEQLEEGTDVDTTVDTNED